MTTAYAGAVVRIGAFAIPLVRLSSLVLAFAILTALHLFLTKARWGRAIRATAEDWEAAALMGIPVGRTYLLAFALGSALAGIAGGLVSVSYSISPSIGLETLKALIVGAGRARIAFEPSPAASCSGSPKLPAPCFSAAPTGRSWDWSCFS